MDSKQLNTDLQEQEKKLQVFTLGQFSVVHPQGTIRSKDWGRDKTIQLFQFLITTRHQRALHKEQIIHRLWPEADQKSGDRDFKVAMHGINKVIEPDKASRSEAKYIIRQGLTYQLVTADIWIDSDALESYIAYGNQQLNSDPKVAKEQLYKAINLHKGNYLPNRLFADWCAEERERLQVLTLAAYISLAELCLEDNPVESIRLSQQALLIDHTWEDAYRIQMEAYTLKGNRPLAIKTYAKCVKVLQKEFGIEPLPITKNLLASIKSK